MSTKRRIREVVHSHPSGKLTSDEVEKVIRFRDTTRLGKRTAVVEAELTTGGFEIVESSSCVDPAAYDAPVGGTLAKEKIRGRVWHLLGFVLQWAKYGIQPK